MTTRPTIEFTNTQCRCGCKQVLSGKKSRFAQGHDARFVSAMRQIAIDGDKGLHTEVTLIDRSSDPAQQSMVSAIEAVERLGSPALKEKLISGFRKEQGRIEDKAQRQTKAALARENAKQRRTSKTKDEAKADEVPAEDVADLDAIAAPVDLDTLEATSQAAVEGEKPVTFKNGGRTRRGSTQSQKDA